MNDITKYVLLQSFVQFTYTTRDIVHITKDIVENHYFGEDTDDLLLQLEDVLSDLVELEL